MPGQIVLALGTSAGHVHQLRIQACRADGAGPVNDLRGLLGVLLSSVFVVYTHTSITRVFFISTASFGA